MVNEGQEKSSRNAKISEIGLRMEPVRKAVGLTGASFSLKLGIPQQTFINYRNGREPPASLLVKIRDEFHVALEWLLTGEGEMFGGHAAREAGPNYAAAAAERVVEQTVTVYVPEKPELVDVIAEIQAGPNGLYCPGAPLYRLPYPQGVDDRPLYGFEVRGDSMWPMYKPGDVVFALLGPAPHQGEHVVVQVDGSGEPELMLKKWSPQIGVGTVRLLSLNPEYDPIVVERRAVQAVARIVAVLWASQVRRARKEIDALKK